ncbi:MAG: rhomboid family intramembrane serine protease [Bacteroidales bacterium]|nr:rhomboid family intramembrane serine protease [Bacteroidales bacterium]
MNQEKKNILQSLFPPLLFVILLWVIKAGEIVTHIEFGFLGIYPLKSTGLIGIITSPLIHSGFKHLFANSIPLLVLGGCLFYFYKEIAVKIFILIYLITGLCVWFGAREAYHIGASGVVYGLASFLFLSGIIRRDGRLLAITMLVTFLYGSLVWGVFPDFYPEKNISFESHFWGLIVGVILALYFRKLGPQRKKYDWEEEEEFEDI